MIDNYSFGKIKIGDKVYNYDIWIDSDGKVNDWRRIESHIIAKEDMENAIQEKPEVLIIGTGAYGVAKVLDEVEEFLNSQNIELIMKKTSEAVENYNNLKKEGKKTVALLHLTC